MITHRRICWPEPDATCLEGGCMYCNDHPYRAMSTIRRYAKRAGILLNRGLGSKPATEALAYGESTGFPNIDTKENV